MNCKKETFFGEVFYFASIIGIFIVLCCTFIPHLGHLLVDCGRSVYISELVLKGEVLYKDIFALYGPLSYQVNAILYAIFGVHLNTLYMAGIVNSFIILALYYLVARKLTSAKVSWLACFLLMGICVFYYYIPNYIFPYSYSMVYALSSFLASVLFCLYYVEKTGPVFLILSALFMGISMACKIDFMLFSPVLFAIAFYFKPLGLKNKLFFLLSFALVPVLSWGALFLQGLSVGDFLHYLQSMREFVDSEALKYFYSSHTGLYPTPVILYGLKKISFEFIYNFSIIFAVFYSFFWIFHKIPDSKSKTVLQVICFMVLYIIFPKNFFKDIGEVISLAWLPVSTTIILLPCFKDKKFALVALAGILAAVKSYFFINLNVFGTFLIPLLILVNLVFIFDKVPKFFGFIPEKPWKNTCFTVIFLLGLVFLLSNVNYAAQWHKYPVETGRGKIYTAKKWALPLNKLITYIDNKIPGGKTFLVMPEGLMINFLTKRESPGWFHAFTPHFVEKFEEKMIYDIQKNRPDYIFITNQETDDYYFKYFCKDYAKGLCRYIRENYDYLERVETGEGDDDFLWADVYVEKPPA